ncbi:MAG: HAD family hydrolase [Patescibacteria group bacterium]
MRIICLDLDEAVLDTMNGLFRPVIIRAAEASGKSVVMATESIGRVSGITFTFPAWFADLGLPEVEWAALEVALRVDLAARAPSCLFPGMRQLLEKNKCMGDRQVLVTAGNLEYQQWKFSLLDLDDIFAEEDRHFVPMNGSKAAAIEPYLAHGQVTFIDDSPKWHHEVAARGWPVRCIRTRWPNTTYAAPHIDDGRLWQTATTAEELQQLLERGAA